MKEIIIGISEGPRYENYERWISAESNVRIIRLGYARNNYEEVRKCQALLLSGGHDVHPRLYGKPEYLSFCAPQNLDEKRDAFEWKLLDYAMGQQLPVLGICRGLQLANVYWGGTLVPDIVASGKSDHTCTPQGDRYHEVRLNPGSLLQRIAGMEKGEINSSHHQCADRIGEGLVANAFSEESIVEGLERKEPEGHPFLLLVQWHPERMHNSESALAAGIRSSFLEAVRAL